MNIFNLPKTEEEAVLLLQNTGILPKERVCPNVANLYFGNAQSNLALKEITIVQALGSVAHVFHLSNQFVSFIDFNEMVQT